MPTLCRLVGVAPPEGVDGSDLSPVIDGSVEAVRNSLFTTYSTTQRAVRNQRWKLIRYPALHYTQLFDLKNDPYELNNLAEDSTYHEQQARLWRELQRWQQQTEDTLPLTAPTPTEMQYDLSDYVRQPDRHQPEYTREKYFSPTKEP